MADDPFMKPEVPEAIRDLMKMSIEQGEARLSDLRCDEREGLEVARHQLAIGTLRNQIAE